MSDLIERQAVLDVFRNLAFDHIFQCGEYYGEDERQLTIINAEKAIDVIESLPSVEPERKTGHWIDTDNYYQRWKCSECGCHTRDAEPNYCPNCGAKMEMKNDE